MSEFHQGSSTDVPVPNPLSTATAAPSSESPQDIFLQSENINHVHQTEFESLRTIFLSALVKQDWVQASEAVDSILIDSALSDREVAAIFNSPIPGKASLCAVHLFVISNAPVALLHKVLRSGCADLSLTSSVQRRDTQAIFHKCSALHLAFVNGHYKKAEMLLRCGHPTDVINAEGDDPVHMMLKHGSLHERSEERASHALGLYYAKGGFVGVRDREGQLPLTYAARGQKWKVALTIAREHRKEKHTTNALPVRKSEVESSALLASLKMEEPAELVAHLAELGRKAVEEELWPTPEEDLHWMKILLEYIPERNQTIFDEAWAPLERVLDEMQKHEGLFDEKTRVRLLNARRERILPETPMSEEEMLIHETLGTLDPKLSDPPTLLHLLVEREAPNALIERAVQLGADPYAPARVRFMSTEYGFETYEAQSAGHYLAAQGNIRALLSLHRAGYNINEPDPNGETPLHKYLDHQVLTGMDLRVLHELLEAGADPDVSDISGNNAHSRAVRHNVRYLKALLEKYSTAEKVITPQSGRKYTIRIDGKPAEISEEALAAEMEHYRGAHGADRKVRAEERKLLEDIGLYGDVRNDYTPEGAPLIDFSLPPFYPSHLGAHVRNPYHWYLYLRSLEENASGKLKSDEYAFTKLLPHLLYNYPVDTSHLLAQALEGTMDSNRYTNGQNQTHPNAVELMALLNHPRDYKRDSRSLGPLTSALSSITYFAGTRKVMTSQIVDLWGKIGTYGYSGILWRFDAERGHGVDDEGKKVIDGPSLLQLYGAHHLAPDAYGRSPVFGPSFLVVPGSKISKRIMKTAAHFSEQLIFDEHTFIELHRGGFLISHPEDGTLFVRNSSPVFGRDLLPEPAYYSPRGIALEERPFSYSIKELIGVTPDFIRNGNNFESVLSHELYKQKSRQVYQEGENDSLPRMRRLMQRLHAFRTDYSRWKFDTKRSTAWRHNPTSDEMDLVGGHFSPGFSAVLNYLERRYKEREAEIQIYGESDRIVPDLGFLHPDFAPFSPYARMKVTDESLGIMRRMAAGKQLTRNEMEESQVQEFFMVGFRQDADLVLLAPERKF